MHVVDVGALAQRAVDVDGQPVALGQRFDGLAAAHRRARAHLVDGLVGQPGGQPVGLRARPFGLSGRRSSSPSQPDRLPAWACRIRYTGTAKR